MDAVTEAIEASDTDALLRIVDQKCRAREWKELEVLRLRLAEAQERGRQLWGVDQHVRYRFALEGPDRLAAAAVEEGPARFALGPLTEVAANRHTFAELRPYLPPGPGRESVALERVAAGESVDRADLSGEMPASLEAWEPKYPLPVYYPDRVESDPPLRPRLESVELPSTFHALDDLGGTEALHNLVAPWLEESNGRGGVSVVHGPPLSALTALGVPAAEVGLISTRQAVAQMAWAAASGGAMGRRRGLAFGRFAARYVVAILGGWDWPATPEEVAEATTRLQWWAWSDLAPEVGWGLHLVAHDPEDEISWAVGVRDAI